MSFKESIGPIAAVLLICLAASCSGSIDMNEPVKVTHKNSGPKYDIDDVEKTRMVPGNEQQALPQWAQGSQHQPEQHNGEREGDINRVSIRRIFLVPMMPGPVQPPDSLWSHPSSPSAERRQPAEATGGENNNWQANGPESAIRQVVPLAMHHFFGQDQASRSPTMGGDEGESESQEQREEQKKAQAIFDPIRMMIEMMHQAMMQAREQRLKEMEGASKSEPEGDLNKDASSKGEKESDTKLMTPSTQTKEEIVNIDGVKYLRKTILNKHVGQNMMFITKKHIYTPLNETDVATVSTTTTSLPTTVAEEQAVGSTTTEAPSSSVKPEAEAPLEVAKKAEEPVSGSTTESPQPEQTTPSSVSPVVSTEPKESEETTTTAKAPSN